MAKQDTAPVPKAAKRRKRKGLRRLITALVVLGILGGLGYAAARMMMGPAEGIIVTPIPEQRISQAPQVEFEQFEGSHITFAYPDTYEIQPPNKDNANSLESHTLIASGMMNKILTVVVTKLPSGKLEDDSSYYMRTLKPEIYQIKPLNVNGEKVMVALNAKDNQQTAFWVHKSADGSKLLTFTMSTVSINSEATAREYQAMLESVRWR
ncbi:MAG TPA: hypothetical protein VF572_02860 [Candidatus Saccharimonadales bacterium]|jgi:hypothetical protein